MERNGEEINKSDKRDKKNFLSQVECFSLANFSLAKKPLNCRLPHILSYCYIKTKILGPIFFELAGTGQQKRHHCQRGKAT